MPALREAEDLTAQYGWTRALHQFPRAVESGGPVCRMVQRDPDVIRAYLGSES
jgi:hypothetical protein